MRGYGPVILEAVPREGTAAAKEILATVAERSVCRAPGLTTLHRHLKELVRMGCVAHYPDGTYRRLVESEFDLPVEVAA